MQPRKQLVQIFHLRKLLVGCKSFFFLVLRIRVDGAVKKTMPYHFNLLHHGRVNTELSKIHEDLEKSLLMKK